MTDGRVSILLVDDRPENLLALEAILEPLNQRLVRAENGPKALRAVLQEDFAVILLDVQMPGMNGFEVAETIKSRERSRFIPIVFLSAISKEDEYVFRGYQMGAVDYVFKPFNPDVLRSKVAVFVDLFLKQKEIESQGEELRRSQVRELELEHRAELLESEAKSAQRLSVLNADLQLQAQALEEAIGSRNRFYASMSHELRTPINAVMGYSTLMLDGIYGPLNDKQVEGLTRTLKAARHLLELVNDVLDLSKIEAGKIELTLQPVAIGPLIDDLLVTVKPLADEHGTKLECELERDYNTIITDPRRVRQILLNLLSNAIKFGGQKPICVRSRGNDGGGVTVEVTDQGDGIGPEDIDRIFEEFVQIKPNQHPGTGLGLPISRRLAHLLDSVLEVDSKPGSGSTFRLIMPAEVKDVTAVQQKLQVVSAA